MILLSAQFRCWRFKKPMAIAWWQRTAWQKFANCFWTAWQLWRLRLFVELVTLETALNPRVHLAFGNASTPHWIAYNVMCFQQFEVYEAALNIMQRGPIPPAHCWGGTGVSSFVLTFTVAIFTLLFPPFFSPQAVLWGPTRIGLNVKVEQHLNRLTSCLKLEN